MKVCLNVPNLWKPDVVRYDGYGALLIVRRILVVMLLALEPRKICLFCEESVVSFSEVKIRIRQRQGIDFFELGKLFLVRRRRTAKRLFRLFIVVDLVRKNPIVDEANAAECLGKKDALFFVWVDAVFISLVDDHSAGSLLSF